MAEKTILISELREEFEKYKRRHPHAMYYDVHVNILEGLFAEIERLKTSISGFLEIFGELSSAVHLDASILPDEKGGHDATP